MSEPAGKRIFFNIAAILGGNAASRACGLILVVVLARYLGPEKYGIYALSLAFFSLFLLIADWGFDTLTIRELAGDRQRLPAILACILSCKQLLALGAVAALFALLQILGYRPLTGTAVMLMAISIFPACCISSLKSLATAFERMEYRSMVEVARSLLALFLVLAAVFFHGGILQIVAAQVLAVSLGLLLATWIIHRGVHPLNGIELSFSGWKPYFFQATPFFLITVVAILNNRIDLIVISFFLEEHAVGTYSAALRLVDILYALPALVCQALFPTMSRLARTDGPGLVELGNTTCKYLILFAVPIGFGLFMIADQLILLIYGDAFLGSAMLLKFFAFSVVLEFAVDAIFWLFVASGRERLVLRMNIAVTGLNVILNLLLIPRYGLLGAALTNVACSASLTAVALVLKSRSLPGLAYLSYYGKPLLAAGMMAAVLFSTRPLPVFVVIPLGAVVYLAGITVSGGIKREELAFLGQLLKKGGPGKE